VISPELDLNDLDTFLRVVRAGSLTGAAKALDVPVSSVSRRLARLEEQLGVRLLHRTTRTLRLTETGEAFHERVARSLAEIEQAQRELVAQGDVPRGRVRMSGPADMTTLGGAIAAFMCKYPDVQVELDLCNRFVDLVGEGYDLALRASSLSDSSLVAHKLTTSTVRIVGSPSYFERHGVPASVEDLHGHAAVAFGTQAGQVVWPLTVNGRPVRATLHARLAVNNVVAAKNAALSGAGLVRLPQLVMDRELQAGLLREVLPETAVETSTVALVYPSRRLVAPAVRALIDHLRSHYRDNPLS
jgi:DNA-binding transcriptional LysR family regulator